MDPTVPDRSILDEAAGVLFRGGLVAFPTETVYGLGADAFQDSAVGRVFAAKGRPPDNPLIVHLSHADQMSQVAQEIPDVAVELGRAFWPGPMTLILRGNGALPSAVTAGLDTVAVRVPDHSVPRQLVDLLGRGIVGPSANFSGRPSPTTGSHVLSDLDGSVDLILDAGPTRIGVESTVVDVTTHPPAILRPGGLSREDLEDRIGPVTLVGSGPLMRRTPGARHRHYAPETPVELVPSGDTARFMALLADHVSAGRAVGAIVRTIVVDPGEPVRVCSAGPGEKEYARTLFAALRELDGSRVDVILVEEVEAVGLGLAVADRLRRAARRS